MKDHLCSIARVMVVGGAQAPHPRVGGGEHLKKVPIVLHKSKMETSRKGAVEDEHTTVKKSPTKYARKNYTILKLLRNAVDSSPLLPPPPKKII